MKFAADPLDAWEEPLTPEEREAILDKAARVIVGRGLQSPAILALEMHKPLAFVAAQTMIVATPLVGPIIGLERMQNLARLFQEPGGVEALIVRIEEMTAATDRDRVTKGDRGGRRKGRSDVSSVAGGSA